jgi:hypothetical protein
MGARDPEKDNTPEQQLSPAVSNLWSIVHRAVSAGWESTARLAVLLLIIRGPLVISVIYLIMRH